MTRRKLLLGLGLLFAALAPARAADDEGGTLPAWQRYAWQDLGVIMTPAEEIEFRELPDAAALDEWQRRFWLRRDPTPTTERNERREIHFKRLETARELYPGDGGLGLDRRGFDYVLFGPPDEMLEIEDWFDETGYHPARVTWVWVDQEIRATYSDWNLDGEWEQAHPELPSSRPDVRYRTEGQLAATSLDDEAGLQEEIQMLRELRTANPEAYQNLVRKMAEGEVVNIQEVQSEALMAELFSHKLRDMEARYHEKRREKKDPYAHDFGVPPLWGVFAVDCFRGEAGRTRVEVSHQVRVRDLNFEWDFDDQVFRGGLRRRVAVFDAEDRLVAGEETELPVTAETLEDTRTATLLPGLGALELPPGRYRLALRLEDARSGAMQIWRTDLAVPAFPAAELRVSDISFAASLTAGTEPAVFRKGEWIVVPHPLRSYDSGAAIHLYFEIYGLGTDAQGLNDYLVTYRIRRRAPQLRSSWLWLREERVDPAVSSTFADRHGGATARHPLSIAAGAFGEDSYLIEVDVEDRISGRTASASAPFSVVPASALR
ncbi:MAG: GWxTD domain-containing protein [Candidatus Krumholzibacteriota bacterium]|nr:GWxTD domain-containing protein [Candidatus Krumholzibacteriota bacterium]